MSYPVVVEMDLREATSELHMVWSDGHRSRFALTYLRGWCPCARCQGHFTEKKVFIPSPGVRLLDVQPVGNYAFQPSWSPEARIITSTAPRSQAGMALMFCITT